MPGLSPSVLVDDIHLLTEQNERFIEACRQGSWPMLQPILAPSFSYLDGYTGDVWDMDRYVKDLTDNPAPHLTIDQLTIHVDGDTAVVSARSRRGPDRDNRYLDTYARRDGAWLCIHACVWPLRQEGATT